MNFIYTYVPKDDDKKLDSEFYLIDVILLVLSASKTKRFKSIEDKIMFHSTKEFYSYLKPLNLFDEFKEIVDDDVYIKNQKYEYCHKNCIYKIKAAISNNEPYINLDHDFVIYDKEYLDLLKQQDLVFSHREYLSEPILRPTYIPTYEMILNRINDNEMLINADTDFVINVSICGGRKFELIKESYIKIWDFYVKNYIILNESPFMTMFLEQFLLKTQIYKNNIDPYYCWDDYKSNKCVHFSGNRYKMEYRKRIVNELIMENVSAYKYILTEFGFFPDYMIKITDN
jgi:hypothetical protein